MMRVMFRLETGFIGASFEEEFEFADNAEAREIDESLKDWADEKMSYMEYEWEAL